MAENVVNEERIARLRKRAEETEKMVSQLRQCVEVLKQKAGKAILHSLVHAPQQFIILFCVVESSNVPAKVTVKSYVLKCMWYF